MIFGRQIELKIESVDGNSKTFFSGHEFEDDFHIEFAVEMGKGFTAKIYNVLRQTFSLCDIKDKKFAKLELYAGYREGINPSLIASGDIITSQYKISNVDRVLEIKGVQKSIEFFSQTTPVTYFNATINAILEAVLQKNNIRKYQINFFDSKLIPQFVSSENLKKDLDELCKKAKLIHYFSRGILVIEPAEFKKQKLSEIVLLDRESGMIGSPERKGLNYQIKSLLNPELAVGEFVRVNYRDNASDEKIESEFKILSGKHTADLQNQFYTEFECVKV